MINAVSLSPNQIYQKYQNQIYQNPIEDYDIAFEEDLTKMKEMCLPLGFLNTTPKENDGVIKVAVSSKKQGKKKKPGKKKKVVPQDYAEEFNSVWWEEHGNEAIMQVWTERYGAFLDNGDQDQDQTSNVNVGGWGDIGVTQNEGWGSSAIPKSNSSSSFNSNSRA